MSILRRGKRIYNFLGPKTSFIIVSMKKTITTFLIFIGLSVTGFSQIFPPEFLCVNSDTLIWNLPNNTCGTFNSYEIYISADETGPFTLLTTITDENQSTYFHATAGGNLWYYYFLSDYNCPGEMQISSDTLDNRPPDVSVIEVVSVENGQVDLSWNISPSPEVIGYIIYRETNIGFIPIDTVFSGTTYTDLNALPNNTVESYFVNALDQCGNTSIFDNPHNTILLETTVDICSQTLLLEWNPYQNWQNPIAEHQIWLSINNGAFQMVDVTTGNATSYLYENANDSDEYCFYVEAVESVTGAMSRSNIFCQTLDIIQPVRELLIKNVSVTPIGEVEVTYSFDTDAEVSQVAVFSNSTGSLAEISNELPPNPIPTEQLFLDANATANSGIVTYQIATTDNCDTIVFSNLGKTIFLKGQAVGGNVNQIIWTPLGIENTSDIVYTIFKISNGTESQIGTASVIDSTFFDQLTVTTADDANACYYVIANATLTLPDGTTESIRSRSNIACVEQPVKIWVPNAFAPRGVNRIFKPLVVFGENATFQMEIFDRYGDKLFESIDVDQGWDGRINGEDAPAGGYVYTISVTQTNGEVVTENGVFVLIR